MPAPLPPAGTELPIVLPVRAWSPLQRWIATLLQLLASAVLLWAGVLALLDLLEGGERISTRAVTRWTLFGALLPLLAVRLLRRWSSASAQLTGQTVALEQGQDRLEVPHSSVDRLVPWAVPLPEPAAAIVLRSSARLERALSLPEAQSLFPGIRFDSQPLLSFAAARRRWHRSGVLAVVWKVVLFPVAVGTLVFRSYQVITYGGPFGEAYALGWGQFLAGYAAFAAAAIAYLALIAFPLRVAAELICFTSARLAPASASAVRRDSAVRRASMVRRGAEIAVRVLYYGGIPALLALRFLL